MTAVSINVGLISFGHSNPIMPTQRSVVGFYFREFVNHIGSESKWRNLAAHKFELQSLLAPRRLRFWQSVFWARNIMPLIGLFTKMAKKDLDCFFGQILGLLRGAGGGFGSNVPLALLIDPRMWLMFPLT